MRQSQIAGPLILLHADMPEFVFFAVQQNFFKKMLDFLRCTLTASRICNKVILDMAPSPP
jgi:hypothetical protein